MAQAAESLQRDPHLRVFLLGAPKIGKSFCTITSMAESVGLGYVIVGGGDKSSIAATTRRTKKFVYDVVRDEEDMEAAIKEAFRGVKEEGWKWVFMDDYNLYASWFEGALRKKFAGGGGAGDADGRRMWPEYTSKLMNIPRRLFGLKTHVIFASHFIAGGPEIDGQRAKSGMGIIPLFRGSLREELPAIFNDILFIEKVSGEKRGDPDRRVFQINPDGVWGPGSRSADGTHTIDADFGAFLRLMQESFGSKGRTR
jgi:hypothetical protein